ncbi:helix-turn-helix domain-containing protein [Haladaptatus sp. CMAA 1911]|uniref:helix-turn-helix domain-containing protein n=1 Tax=unclassified Haladaptatus TaxID=2622732 RepID=UPI0037540D42
MATKNTRAGEDAPEDPADLLPETSVLSLDEYLAMQAAIGERTRFEIVYRLVHSGEMSPTHLDEVMDIDDSTLHYHLNKLRDVGLIEKRIRTERDSRGLNTYYRATALGEVILEHGVEELLRREWDFNEAYDSSTDDEEST